MSESTELTRFSDLPTETLRAMAVKTDNGQANWNQWTREMLLALFANRFGKYVPEEKPNASAV